MTEPIDDKAVHQHRVGKLLMVFGLVTLVVGVFLWNAGTTLAPVLILIGCADMLAAAFFIYKGRSRG